MVMVGGVEIDVNLNYEGVFSALKDLERKAGSTRLTPSIGIDPSVYRSLERDINTMARRVVVKKICVPIDICEDGINKVEKKFYTLKRKLEKESINIKVVSSQSGSFSGGGSSNTNKCLCSSEISAVGKTIANEIKALKNEINSGFKNSVSSTNSTTSAVGPLRMMGQVASELKTISRNTRKQGFLSSVIGSAVDGFIMGAMNKSGLKFSENLNKVLTKGTRNNISNTQSQITQSRSNVNQLRQQKKTLNNTEPTFVIDEQIKQEENRIKELNKELKRLESQLDDSFDFLGGKQLAVKAIRLKKFGDSVAKNVFAFKDLKEVKDLSLDVVGTFFNTFTDERFLQEMEDTYVDYMQQVGKLGADAKAEQEKAIKRLTGRFDRVTEKMRARVVGAGLKSVAQPFRVRKRIELAGSAEKVKSQLPLMQNVTGDKKEAIEKAEQIIVFMGGVQPGASKPGKPEVGSTYVVGNLLAGQMPNSYVEKVTNDVSNSYEGVKESPSFKLREGIANFLLENRKTIEPFMPDSELFDNLGKEIELHPLDRNIQVNFQGFDEDAIKLAIRALTLAKEFPDKKIALVAASGGGFSVEEAMAIIQQVARQYPEMESLTKNIVGGMGLGTPHFNLTPTAAPGTATQNLGYSDYFTTALGLPTVGTSKNSKEYKETLKHLPGGIKLPDDTIRPGGNYSPLPGGAEHNIGKMVVFGFKQGSSLSKASPHVFGQDRLSFPKTEGSPGLYLMAEQFAGIEAALWHLSEKGPAHKWALDEAITLPLEKLEELVNTPLENFDYANGIRLQQTWFSARQNVIRGGVDTAEGKELHNLLDKVGEEIEKLANVGYKKGLYQVVSNETKPDTYVAKEGGFLTREEAQKWIDVPGNILNPDNNLPLTEIKPDLGVLEEIAQIGKDSLLPEVIEKYNKMPESNPLQSQMKAVVGAFVEFQKKDLELYRAFLQDVLTLRKKIMNGDEQSKNDLTDLMQSSIFSIVDKNYNNNDLVSKAAGVLLQTASLGRVKKGKPATFDGKELSLNEDKELFFDGKKIESFPFEITAESATVEGKTTPLKTGSAFVDEKNRISAPIQDINYATFPGLSLAGVEDIHGETRDLLAEYISSGGEITEEIKKKVNKLVETYRFLSGSLNTLHKTLKNEETPPTPHSSYVNNPVLFQEFLDKNKGKSFDELLSLSQSLGPVQQPDLSIVSKEIEQVQETVSSGLTTTIRKYLSDLGKEIYAIGLDKTLDPASAQEAIKRINSALEGLNKLKEVLPDKIPNKKGKLSPTGSVLGGYKSQLVQAKNKIEEGNPPVPINFKLGQLTKDIVAGLELTGADTSQLMEFADSITDPVTGKIKDNWGIHSPSDFTEWCTDMLIAGLKLAGVDIQKVEQVGDQISSSLKNSVKKGIRSAGPDLKKEVQLLNKTFGEIIISPTIITPPVKIAGLLPSAEMLREQRESYLKEWTSLLQEMTRIRFDFETEWRKNDSSTIKFLPPAKEESPASLITPPPAGIKGLLPYSGMRKRDQEIREAMELISLLLDTDITKARFDLDTEWSQSNGGRVLPPAQGFSPAGLLPFSKNISSIDNSLSKIFKEMIKLLPSLQAMKKEQEYLKIKELIDILSDPSFTRSRFELDSKWEENPRLIEPAQNSMSLLSLPSAEMRSAQEARRKQIIKQERGMNRGLNALGKEVFPAHLLEYLPTQRSLPSSEMMESMRKIREEQKIEIATLAREISGIVESLPDRVSPLIPSPNALSLTNQANQESPVSQEEKEQVVRLAREFFDPRVFGKKVEASTEPESKSIKALPGTAEPRVPRPKVDFISPAILLSQIGMLIAYKDTIIDIGMASIAVAREFEVLTNTLNYLSNGVENGKEKFAELKDMSQSMGVDFKTVLGSYNQLAASTRNTSLEGATTDDLIKGITQAGVTFGLSSEEIQGSILAVSQIAGKGVVSAEELRGQLAERIPGAFQIAARSMKMTEKELYQLMATGQIASSEFLPKFARQLSLESGAGISGASSLATASLNRLGNSIQDLQMQIGNALMPVYTLGVNLAGMGVEIVSSNLGHIAKQILAFGLSLSVASGQFVKIAASTAKSLAVWIGLPSMMATAAQLTKEAFTSMAKSIVASMARTATIFAIISVGIEVFDVFVKAFDDTTVYDKWADNIESNIKRVNEALSGIKSNGLPEVKPENRIRKTGNYFYDLFTANPEDVKNRISYENKKREKKGLGPMSKEETDKLVDSYNNLAPGSMANRDKEQATIVRQVQSQLVENNFAAPIRKVMEQYKNGNGGPLGQIAELDKKIKGLKAQQAVLDPADVETAKSLAEQLRVAEKAKEDLLAPLDAQEGALRQSLADDQERLKRYQQALIDQNSDDENKRKKAEELLTTPGNDAESMAQVQTDIKLTTSLLDAYEKQQARSGAVNDTKKLALAMMELGFAFASVEQRVNAIHIGKLKAIAQLQVKGFSSDRFNDTSTGLRTAEENYNNTQRLLQERKSTMAKLQKDIDLNPTKDAANELIKAEEEKKGRALTPEEINALSDLYAKEGQEQLRQAFGAEAKMREEKQKTAEMEKQSVEEIYAIRQARQAHYLAIYEDAIDEIKQLDQRNFSNAMTGANNQLARGLRSDLGAEDSFSVRASELQYINVKKQIDNIPIALKSLEQAYYRGDLSLEQYTTRSRALLTEDAQLKQQLVEQEISHIKLLSQTRMNALQRIKESRDANTSIANSNRNKGVTKNSIDDFRSDQFLSNNESLAKSKNALTEISHQLNNTKKELSELEAEYATGEVLLNDYIQKKRQLLVAQAQEESQLADAQMAKMRAVEDYRLAMLDRARAIIENRNAINNASVLTQLAQNQMTGNMSDSEVSRVSAENTLNNARLAVEVSQEAITKTQQAYKKRELSAEKYHERLRQLNLEQAQNLQQVAEGELALWKAKEAEKISILEKSFEKQERLNKLNQMKMQIPNKQLLIGQTEYGGANELYGSILENKETNSQNDNQISSISKRLEGMKNIKNPTKDLQDKILATEQELNESILNKRLTLLDQELNYKKQILNATQLENKAIENQLTIIDSQAKLYQLMIEVSKKRLENEIASMERIKTLSDEIGSASVESVKSRSQFDDAIAIKRLKALDIELKANVRNLEIEQHREVLSQRKAENESRMAVLQAKNTALIASQSGNTDAIALAQQQLSLANESLSVILQQGQSMSRLHDTQKTKLALEHKGTLAAEKYAKIQDTINSKLKTANSYLDKQKERLDSINELNKAINSAKTNVLEKRAGIADKGIDLYDTINGTEKITDPNENPVLMKELQAQLKAIGGNTTDPKAMYAERLRLEESLANQKMNALVTEQNMQKTLLQIEFDKYELQAQALILQAKMLALQSKGTDNEASANQLLKDAMEGMRQLEERRKDAMGALGINQETERYNQGIENTNAINETRRRSAEAGYTPGGSPIKYPGSGNTEASNSNQRFGYTPSFNLNEAARGLMSGSATTLNNGIVPGKINIPNEPGIKDATYKPLNINEQLLSPDLIERTDKNTQAMYELSSNIVSLTEALTNNQPANTSGQPINTNTLVNVPAGTKSGTGQQVVTNNLNYGGVTIISSDPTGDARKVLNDLAKANKNKF